MAVLKVYNPDTGQWETIGGDGKSAYELALEIDPNIGTEAQWLESLKASVTKPAIESVLTGTITTHTHTGLDTDSHIDMGNPMTLLQFDPEVDYILDGGTPAYLKSLEV